MKITFRGSNYLATPKFFSIIIGWVVNGGVAQVVRARGSYPRSHWFESSHRHMGLQT